jgi:hypothetical protein
MLSAKDKAGYGLDMGWTESRPDPIKENNFL